MQIAIVTCKQLPEPDLDAPALDQGLRAAGLEPVLVAWDDPAVRWADYPLAIIRSTWNYFTDREGFVAWAERTGSVTKLLNPASVVRWNTDKTYLREVEKRGVAIVPTAFVDQGQSIDIGQLMAERGWDPIVVKPVVSAGSYRTERFTKDQIPAAQAFLDDLVRSRGAMVQRFMASVDGYGERSIVWIDGAITHAIRKSPRFIGGDERVSEEVPVADDERAFAERAIEPFADELLYARIDVVRADDGSLCLMELELVEPSLFFVQCPRALVPFVRAIQRRAQ